MRIRGFAILALFAAFALPSAAHAQAPNQRGRRRTRLLIRACVLAALLLVVFVPVGSGQGSRKDDIVLNRFGQPVAGATVTVCTSGATGTPCSPLASIFSDIALTQPLANPLTSDGQGNYHFYAAPGRYMIQVSGAGVSTTTIPDVLLPADPTSPSFQTLSVSQNISALNLNLSGNLSVSGGVSSPSTISAPQQGSSAPVEIGPHWYAGTASGQCTTPGAPAVVVETISSGTGTIGTASYQYKVALYNRNGITKMGPATTYAAPSGSTNRILVQLGSGDYSYRSGCYGYRVYVSSDGGNTFWQQNAWTLPAAGISSWTRNAAGLVTITTSAAHGFIPGESITISGASAGSNSTSINGTFTLVGQQVSSPGTLFFFQSSSLGADTGSSGGTGTVIAGLGADPAGHFAPGDFILSTILTSGMQGPTTSTATIDPIQVALNATCNYATNSCAAGGYDAPQGTTTLTTPLIVSNQETVIGVNSPVATGKSTINCAWKDPNLGCVMVQGVANGVRIEGLDIESAGHGLMLTGWGPGFANQNQFIRNNNINSSDTSGQYSAIYFHVGTWYNEHFENNLLGAFLAGIQMDGQCGGWWFISGSRWNIGGSGDYAAGLASNGLLSVSSVTDPDRAQLRGAFPNGAGMVEVSNLFTESQTGVQFDAVNLGLKLKNVLTADPQVLAATPALVRIGADANSTGANFSVGVEIEDTYLQGATFTASTAIQLISNYQNALGSVTLRNFQHGQTNAIDYNSVSMPVTVYNSLVNPYESATFAKIINLPSNGSVPTVVGTVWGGTNNSLYGQNLFNGCTIFKYPQYSASKEQYWCMGAGNGGSSTALNIYSGDPNTAALRFALFSGSSSATHFQVFSPVDGATIVADLQGNTFGNAVNFLAPVNPANGYVNIGGNLRFENGAATSGHYFQFGGTPSGARTITWPDASGTVAYVLSGTSGSLGGSALTAGTCSSTTVTISGATTSMTATASPASDPGSGYYWLAFVSASNTVTVRICAAASGTPTSTTYNVRVIQ